jgi:hypothetical protein
MFDTVFVGMLMIHLHTKFHTPSTETSLLIVIKPKAKLGSVEFARTPCFIIFYKEIT